jgi:hypothetical protein
MTTLGAGKRRAAALIAVGALVLSACSTSKAPQDLTAGPGKTFATPAQVLEAVQAAETVNDLPSKVGFLTKDDWPMVAEEFDCHNPVGQPANIVDPKRTVFGQCASGDRHGTKLMVTFGDSRAGMWGAALEAIAAKDGYKLRSYHMGNCPPLDLRFFEYEKQVPDEDCHQFREAAIDEIRKLHPEVVFVTSFSTHMLEDRSQPTAVEWEKGWESTLKELTQAGTKLVMFGDIPDWEKDDQHCLAGHPMAVQKCSVPKSEGTPSGNLDAERAAASATGTMYVPTLQWVCANRCEPVIADTRVYQDRFHFTNSYTRYLTGAVDEALRPALS